VQRGLPRELSRVAWRTRHVTGGSQDVAAVDRRGRENRCANAIPCSTAMPTRWWVTALFRRPS